MMMDAENIELIDGTSFTSNTCEVLRGTGMFYVPYVL
jgi:hypothetical protein